MCEEFMRQIICTAGASILVLTVLLGGCQPAPRRVPEPHPQPQDIKQAGAGSDVSVCAAYAPVKIEILPLTELVGSGESTRANVYVSLLDTSGCQTKSPGVFRFELYEYVQRSAEPKGQRLVAWPDIDLTELSHNSGYWRDFLRSYEFNLDFQPSGGRTFVLQATFLTPAGKRLNDEFTVRLAK